MNDNQPGFSPDSMVLMYDGSARLVRNVQPGDILMGANLQPVRIARVVAVPQPQYPTWAIFLVSCLVLVSIQMWNIAARLAHITFTMGAWWLVFIAALLFGAGSWLAGYMNGHNDGQRTECIRHLNLTNSPSSSQ